MPHRHDTEQDDLYALDIDSSKLITIAIVGRPNVGKSTLFNRIIHKKRSIMENTPGITRDRVYHLAKHRDYIFQLVDTGGLEDYHSEEKNSAIDAQVKIQAQKAIEESQMVLAIVDATQGLQPADREIIQKIRKTSKPFLLVINKSDNPQKNDLVSSEFYAVGADYLFPISATLGHGVNELLDFLVQGFETHYISPVIENNVDSDNEFTDHTVDNNQFYESDESEHNIPAGSDDTFSYQRYTYFGLPKIIILGKPNVGKSSLINALLKEDRMIVSDQAGTTRDTVDTIVEFNDKKYCFLDTAGIRRKKNIEKPEEIYSVRIALEYMKRADMAVILLDSTEEISVQDIKIVEMAINSYRPLIIGLSKHDLKTKILTGEGVQNLVNDELYMKNCPVVSLSSKTGKGIHLLFQTIESVFEKAQKRIETSDLNHHLEMWIKRNPPPHDQNIFPRVSYVTQPAIMPPTFIFSCRHAQRLKPAYKKFLHSKIADTFGLEGIPLKMIFKNNS